MFHYEVRRGRSEQRSPRNGRTIYVVFNRCLFKNNKRVRIPYNRRLYENFYRVALDRMTAVSQVGNKTFPSVEDLELFHQTACTDRHMHERLMTRDLLKG